MIKINGAACCSALKYLQGVNIYQQSLKQCRITAIKPPQERSTSHTDGCEPFFFVLRKHIMAHAFDVRLLHRCCKMLHKTASPF